MLRFLDILLLLSHLALILFNLFGWLWKRTRVLHLISVGLTLASWTILGIWYGFGFCPLTEWHWQVMEKLGRTDLPHSYLKYLLDRLTGLNWNATIVDAITVTGVAFALTASVWVNFLKQREK